MTYTLRRGTDLLGRVEIRRPEGLRGVLIPRDGNVVLRGETQTHLSILQKSSTTIFSMPDEPEVIDGPPRAGNSSGGSFALQPVTDDMMVAPEDVLHLFKDDDEIRATSVWLHEKRYLHEVPAEPRLELPAGALRGQSFWEVTVVPDAGVHDEVDFDELLRDLDTDESSP